MHEIECAVRVRRGTRVNILADHGLGDLPALPPYSTFGRQHRLVVRWDSWIRGIHAT